MAPSMVRRYDENQSRESRSRHAACSYQSSRPKSPWVTPTSARLARTSSSPVSDRATPPLRGNVRVHVWHAGNERLDGRRWIREQPIREPRIGELGFSAGGPGTNRSCGRRPCAGSGGRRHAGRECRDRAACRRCAIRPACRAPATSRALALCNSRRSSGPMATAGRAGSIPARHNTSSTRRLPRPAIRA